jgi:hypothetical protein
MYTSNEYYDRLNDPNTTNDREDILLKHYRQRYEYPNHPNTAIVKYRTLIHVKNPPARPVDRFMNKHLWSWMNGRPIGGLNVPILFHPPTFTMVDTDDIDYSS